MSCAYAFEFLYIPNDCSVPCLPVTVSTMMDIDSLLFWNSQSQNLVHSFLSCLGHGVYLQHKKTN